MVQIIYHYYDRNMTIGRPKEFDRKEVLEVALHKFWQQGYHVTSVQELIDQMGLSKSSFYQAFGSKKKLFIDCLTHYTDMRVDGFLQGLQPGTSGISIIENFFKSIPNQENKAGCLLVNSANEFGQRDLELSEAVKKSYSRIEKVFLKAIKQSQKEKKLSSKISAADLARSLVCNLSGLQTLSHAGMDKRYLSNQVKLIIKKIH